MLLAKYESESTNTKSTLDNFELTEKNLLEHKRIIKDLIGQVHKEQDKAFLNELELKQTQSEINAWIWNWD